MTEEDAVDAYCAAWNEPDTARRETILEAVWSEEAIYTDPTVQTVGIADLVNHIGTVLARYPNTRIVRTSAVDLHHGLAVFGWKRVRADGTSLRDGLDFAEFRSDRKLTRIVGFFGPLPGLSR